MEKQKTKAVLLCRVSTQTQDLQRQIDKLRALAAADGFKGDDVIEITNKESAILLSMDEREGIARLQEVCEEQPVAAVYLHELSRLSRRATDIYKIRDFLVARGINLITATPPMRLLDENGKISDTASLIMSIFSSMAESECAIRRERTITGKARKAADGFYTGGWVPFGYQVNAERRYEPSADADTVRLIYRLYADGGSTYSVADHLIKNRLYPGDVTKISRALSYMIKNDVYKGARPGYPALVSEELWRAAVDRMAKATTRRSAGAAHIKRKLYPLLNGLIEDAAGARMYHDRTDGCYKTPHVPGQKRTIIASPKLHEVAWRHIKEAIGNSRDDEGRALLDARIAETEARIGALVEEAARIKETQERLTRVYTVGRISAERYEKEYGEGEKRIKDILSADLKLRVQLNEYKEERRRLEQGLPDNLDDEARARYAGMALRAVIVEKTERFHVYVVTIVLADGRRFVYDANLTPSGDGFKPRQD